MRHMIPTLSVNLALSLFAASSWAEAIPDTEQEPDTPQTEQDTSQKRGDFRPGRHGRQQAREMIERYMLEQGDITQSQLDQQREERKALREDIRALKQAVDEAALAKLREELKTKKQARREEIKAYLEKHPQLQEQLAEQREKIKQQRRDCLRGKHR
ncbi:hypothetical protein R50073_45620 [Maricurvus nonylphenolicus]|uniref:hypothetical protein n=1 Tax=Maricurvus nonylphenolicus TaxID=1008307 RepID=UPI0036F41829